MAGVIAGSGGKTLGGGATMKSGAAINKPGPSMGGAKTTPTGPKAVETSKTPKRRVAKASKGAGAASSYNRGMALREKIKEKYGKK